MPRRVDTAETERLLDAGAQLIEVLPRSDYDRAHLPGARSIPLDSMQPESVVDLDRSATTIVYCYDYQCDLSARAARRLETLGFRDVCDYVASKAAWMGCGLPVEGTAKPSARAGSVARTDIPRCSLGEKVGDVRDRFGNESVCVVVDDDGTVLGAVRKEATQLVDTTLIDEVLQPAPPTVRPSITTAELARSMARDGRTYVYVTTLEGKLIGLVTRSDLHGQH